MIDKNDKDTIISFLRERLMQISKIAKNYNNSVNENMYNMPTGYEKIEDLVDHTLMDTMW